MELVRIGSRGSQLALWQAEHVAAALRNRGYRVAIEVITTTGDRVLEVSLSQVGAKGMFTKEIEDALAAGHIDLAVHSLKDVPTELHRDFELGAILQREEARDAFVSQDFSGISALPPAARVGTSSLRRQALLKAIRPDLQIFPVRGNVDTRLKKLAGGEFAGMVLAAAGLGRLGRMEMVREIISPETMCPAAGQGALAIEIRSGDARTREQIAFLDDARTRSEINCERSLLKALGGGCQVPIGAWAETRDGELHLIAVVAHPDGTKVLRQRGSGKDGERLGEEVAEGLWKQGAGSILKEVAASSATTPAQP